MAKYAKNSIHDSPQLSLNVIRSAIDLATSLGEGESERYIARAESELNGLAQQKGMQSELAEQIDVIKARLFCLKNDKKSAEKLMNNSSANTEGLSMEDNLDKMKAFHELGMREQCISILDTLRKQIEGDTFSSHVVDEYLKQESIERAEIQFTTKELKHMATVHYKENRLVPAYNNLRQALTIAPNDKQIALSLLKVLVQLNISQPLTTAQYDVATNAATMLMNEKLAPVQSEKRDQYIARLGLNLDEDKLGNVVSILGKRAS